MSKSVARVRAALAAAGLTDTIVEVTQSTKTAAQAADVLGIIEDRIAKSIIMKGVDDGALVLFVTAGGNRVALERAETLFGQGIERADASAIREFTGFAIGGVSPIGHLNPITVFFDRRLTEFDTVWAAAGTPNHMFEMEPNALSEICGGQIADFVEG